MVDNLANLSPARLERQIRNLENVIEMYSGIVADAERYDARERITAARNRRNALVRLAPLLNEKRRRRAREGFHEFQTAMRVGVLEKKQPKLSRSMMEQIGRELYKM
jgi:hypothetical protein